MGNEYLHLQRYEEAASAYQQAIDIDPDFADPMNGLGEVYRKQERYRDAVEFFQGAITLKPDYALAYHNLGVSQALLVRYNEAIESLREAVRLNPKDWVGRYNLAVICLGIGDREAALKQYQSLESTAPDLAKKLDALLHEKKR